MSAKVAPAKPRVPRVMMRRRRRRGVMSASLRCYRFREAHDDRMSSFLEEEGRNRRSCRLCRFHRSEAPPAEAVAGLSLQSEGESEEWIRSLGTMRGLAQRFLLAGDRDL